MNMSASTPISKEVIPSRQCAGLIDGVQTEVTTQAYSDRTLVLITQTGKIGTLTQVTVPLASLEQGFEISPPSQDGLVPALPVPFMSLQITPLINSTPPELKPIYDMYLNQVGMLVFTSFTPGSTSCLGLRNLVTKPVIIGLALTRQPANREDDMASERIRFSSIMKMVMECKVW